MKRCCPAMEGNTIPITHTAGGRKRGGESEEQCQTGNRELTTQCSQNFLQASIDKEVHLILYFPPKYIPTVPRHILCFLHSRHILGHCGETTS